MLGEAMLSWSQHGYGAMCGSFSGFNWKWNAYLVDGYVVIYCWDVCGCNYLSFGGDTAMLGTVGRPSALCFFFVPELLYVNHTSLDPVDRAWVRFWREAVAAEAFADRGVPVMVRTYSASAKTTLLSLEI